jgi:hypothetical protein
MRQGGDCSAVCVRLTREIGAGAAAVVVVGFAAVVLCPAGDLAGRVLVMAVTCGLLAGVFADWRAAVVVAGSAVLVFVGFLADGAGGQGPEPPLSYVPIIGVATLLGVGHRRMTHPAPEAPAPKR